MQQSGAVSMAAATRPANEAVAYAALSFMSVGWAAAFIAGKVVLDSGKEVDLTILRDPKE